MAIRGTLLDAYRAALAELDAPGEASAARRPARWAGQWVAEEMARAATALDERSGSTNGHHRRLFERVLQEQLERHLATATDRFSQPATALTDDPATHVDLYLGGDVRPKVLWDGVARSQDGGPALTPLVGDVATAWSEARGADPVVPDGGRASNERVDPRALNAIMVGSLLQAKGRIALQDIARKMERLGTGAKPTISEQALHGLLRDGMSATSLWEHGRAIDDALDGRRRTEFGPAADRAKVVLEGIAFLRKNKIPSGNIRRIRQDILSSVVGGDLAGAEERLHGLAEAHPDWVNPITLQELGLPIATPAARSSDGATGVTGERPDPSTLRRDHGWGERRAGQAWLDRDRQQVVTVVPTGDGAHLRLERRAVEQPAPDAELGHLRAIAEAGTQEDLDAPAARKLLSTLHPLFSDEVAAARGSGGFEGRERVRLLEALAGAGAVDIDPQRLSAEAEHEFRQRAAGRPSAAGADQRQATDPLQRSTRPVRAARRVEVGRPPDGSKPTFAPAPGDRRGPERILREFIREHGGRVYLGNDAQGAPCAFYLRDSSGSNEVAEPVAYVSRRLARYTHRQQGRASTEEVALWSEPRQISSPDDPLVRAIQDGHLTLAPGMTEGAAEIRSDRRFSVRTPDGGSREVLGSRVPPQVADALRQKGVVNVRAVPPPRPAVAPAKRMGRPTGTKRPGPTDLS